MVFDLYLCSSVGVMWLGPEPKRTPPKRKVASPPLTLGISMFYVQQSGQERRLLSATISLIVDLVPLHNSQSCHFYIHTTLFSGVERLPFPKLGTENDPFWDHFGDHFWLTLGYVFRIKCQTIDTPVSAISDK